MKDCCRFTIPLNEAIIISLPSIELLATTFRLTMLMSPLAVMLILPPALVSDAPFRSTSPCLELIVTLLATNLASSLMEIVLLPLNTTSKRLPSSATT